MWDQLAIGFIIEFGILFLLIRCKRIIGVIKVTIAVVFFLFKVIIEVIIKIFFVELLTRVILINIEIAPGSIRRCDAWWNLDPSLLFLD